MAGRREVFQPGSHIFFSFFNNTFGVILGVLLLFIAYCSFNLLNMLIHAMFVVKCLVQLAKYLNLSLIVTLV